MEKFVAIGFIRKPHGINGEMKVQVDDTFLEDFLKVKVVFLEVGGHKTPYFVHSTRSAQELFLCLEDVEDRETASGLANKEIFLRDQDLSAPVPLPVDGSPAAASYQILEGFTIEDLHVGRVGVIEEVVDLPQQWIAILHYRGREVMVPLHPDLILSIDAGQRLIRMDLPEGLLEL